MINRANIEAKAMIPDFIKHLFDSPLNETEFLTLFFEFKSVISYQLFKAEFGASPVPPLEVVLDVVIGLHSDPVGHLSVLLYLLPESLLKLVALVCSLIILPF